MPRWTTSSRTLRSLSSNWSQLRTARLLLVTESGFDKIPTNRRAEAFRMNERGWAAQLENIEHHVR
jgi:hypothetical protein